MARLRSIEEVKSDLRKKALVVKKLLSTPEGRALLEIIEAEFCAGKTGAKLIGADPQQTAYRVGAYDVVLYLRQLAHYNPPAVDPLG